MDQQRAALLMAFFALRTPEAALGQATFRAVSDSVGKPAPDGSRLTGAMSDSGGGAVAALFDTGTWHPTPLPHVPGSLYDLGWCVSRNGRVVAGGTTTDQQSPSSWRAAAWHDGVPLVLEPLPPEIQPSSPPRPFSISADGSVIVGYAGFSIVPYECVALAWRGEQGTLQILPPLLGDQYATAFAVTADGSVIAGLSMLHGASVERVRAVRWVNGGPAEEMLPDWPHSWAADISPDGRTAIGLGARQGDTSSHLFRWRDGRAELIDTSPWWPWPTSISDDGTVLAFLGWLEDNTYTAAFWTPAAGSRSLLSVLAASGALPDPENWQLSHPLMSGTGRVFAGEGYHLEASVWRYAHWVATLPPEQVCYANCDVSTTPPALNVADFACFLQRYAAGDEYANCDQSTAPPVLNVADFACFLQRFAAGCG